MFKFVTFTFTLTLSAFVFALAGGCNLVTRKNYRKTKKASESLFVTNSFLMERGSSPADAIVRFKTLKPVMCELSYWKQGLGEQPPPNEAKLKACSNTNPSQDFTETVSGLSVSELYFVKISAWETGSDRSKAVAVIVKEQPASTSSIDAYYARINVPLKSVDIHRINATKSLVELVKPEISRERKCSKAISGKTPAAIFEPKAGVLLEGVVSKGLVEGSVEKNSASSDRLTSSKPTTTFNPALDLTYRFSGKSGSVSLGTFATLTSVKAISDQTGNFPEPQLTVAEREIISLNKGRSLRLEWNLNNPESASFVGLQLGYPGQSSSVLCIFDAKNGFGEVPIEYLKDFPSGKHDMSLSVLSYVVRNSDDSTLFAWAAAFSDWRVTKFQVL